MLALLPFLPWVLGGLAALGAAVLGAHRLSPAGRGRARLAGALRDARSSRRALESELADRQKALGGAARDYARAWRDGELRGADLEVLRDHGASGARLEPLRGSGYGSVGDLLGVSARSLERIHGVGRSTAQKIQGAVVELRRSLEEREVPLPGPAPSSPAEVRLADAALDALDGRELGAPALSRAVDALAPLEAEAERARRDSSLWAWIGGSARGPGGRDLGDRAEAIAARLARAAGEEAGGVGQALEGLSELRRRERAEDRRLRRYQERFAACTAVVEEALAGVEGRRRRRARDGRGGLAEEVVRRVEAATLRPGGLRATLRPYQTFGARFLLVQERALLGDEMGLGKTVQALALMTHLAVDLRTPRFVVLAPAGLLVNWEREVARFTDLVPRVLHGEDLTDSLAAWLAEGGVAITSYTTLRVCELGRLLEEAEVSPDLCVADEAHYVKNPEAGRTREARRVLERSDRVALLSGTPMENHPREFLELVRGIRPADAAELEALGIDSVRDGSHAGTFQESTSRLYLRRNQEDVLTELPERLELEDWVDLGPADLAAYHGEVRSRNPMGMRRAVTLGAGEGSAKLARLDELLEEYRAEGRKVLVFSYFLGVLEAVARRPGALEVLSGRLAPAERQALCDRFTEAEGFALLPAQIVAGGVGLNLQAATVVVLCEPQLKPSTEEQAIARAHRMGQTRRVLVHRLLARGTCDETLLELLAGKSELFDAYARESRVADLAPSARRDEDEAGLSTRMIEAELRRLGEADAAAAPES